MLLWVQIETISPGPTPCFLSHNAHRILSSANFPYVHVFPV